MLDATTTSYDYTPGNYNPCKTKIDWPEPPAPAPVHSPVHRPVQELALGNLVESPEHGLSHDELYEWLVDVAATLAIAGVPANTFVDPRDNGLYVLCTEQHTELVEEVSRVSLGILKKKRIVRESLAKSGILSFQCTQFAEEGK